MATATAGRRRQSRKARQLKRDGYEIAELDWGDSDPKARDELEDWRTPDEDDEWDERWIDHGADPDDDWEDRDPPPGFWDEDDLE